MVPVWALVISIIFGIIAGLVAGFFGARHFLKKEIKKNPPISEKQIKAMFMQMGRKPSEAQVRSIMKSMRDTK